MFLTAITIVFDGIDNQLLGVVIPTVMNEWGVARSAFAPVLSLGYAGMMVGGALAGLAGDRFGRRRALLGERGGVRRDDAGHRGGERPDDAGGAAVSRRDRARWRAAQRRHARCRVRAASATADGGDGDDRLRAARRDARRDPRQSVAGNDRLARAVRRRRRRSSRRRGGAGATVAGIPALPGAPSGAMAGARAARRKARPSGAARIGVRGFDGSGLVKRVAKLVALRRRVPSRHDRAVVLLLQLLLAVYLGFSWLPTVLAGAGFGPGVASNGITAFNLGGVVGALASGAVMSRIGSRAAMLTMNSAPSPAR